MNRDTKTWWHLYATALETQLRFSIDLVRAGGDISAEGAFLRAIRQADEIYSNYRQKDRA